MMIAPSVDQETTYHGRNHAENAVIRRYSRQLQRLFLVILGKMFVQGLGSAGLTAAHTLEEVNRSIASPIPEAARRVKMACAKLGSHG
jgi:hypothetical protein